MAFERRSLTLFFMVALAAMLCVPAGARPQPEWRPGPDARFMPREVVVFPRDPEQSRALAQRMRGQGFLVLARGPVSGMILAATPIEGLEEFACEWMKTWPEVRAAEQNICGRSLGYQPEAACPFAAPTPGPTCATAVGLPYPDLQLVAPCPAVPPAGHPNDPAFCFQWGLKNTGQLVVDRGGVPPPPTAYNNCCWIQAATPGIDVNVLPAWEFTTGSSLVTVAVLDSGVEYCNPDFDPARFLYPDLSLTCIGNEGTGYPCCPDPGGASEEPCVFGPARDNTGHGTIVASIIGAKVGNGLGIAGMDQQCRILSCRVIGRNGTAVNFSSPAVNAARAVIALETIAGNPLYSSVRVINMSFWLENLSQTPQQIAAFESAVDLVTAQGRIVVAGAGNFGLGTADTGSPANFPNAITVGAIDSNGWRVQRLCAFDTHVNGSASSTGAAVDFVAPGMAEVGLICQSNPCPLCSYSTFPCDSAYYQNFAWGTSFAAPKICAAISLILAGAIEIGVVNPTTWAGLTRDQVYDLLKAGARDRVSHVPGAIGDPDDTSGRDNFYGWGLIDVRASICELRRVYGPGCE